LYKANDDPHSKTNIGEKHKDVAGFAGHGEAHCSTWQECRENKQSQRRLRQIHVPQSNIDGDAGS
jgi:hypothetical protein